MSMIRRWILRTQKRADEAGSTVVEFALVGTIFFLLIFAIIDFGFLFYARVTLQNAVRQAARYAITGNCNNPGNCFVNGGTGNRYSTIVQTVQNFAFAVPPTSITITCISGSCPNYSGGGTGGNAGGPQDTIQVTAQYTFQPVIIGKFFSGGNYPITVSATFKNEPFPPPAN